MGTRKRISRSVEYIIDKDYNKVLKKSKLAYRGYGCFSIFKAYENSDYYTSVSGIAGNEDHWIFNSDKNRWVKEV